MSSARLQRAGHGRILPAMPTTTPAYAALGAKQPLTPHTIERRDVGPRDVAIDIKFCGVCHSDLHQVNADWGDKIYPMVPGHEIVGVVSAVGREVTRYNAGDRVGVGCMVNSCRECAECKAGEEQFCANVVWTYNSHERDGKTPTYGGYSTAVVVDEAFVVRIPDGLPFDRAAPLLCAGITTYSPMRHFAVGQGTRVGVVGLGGLGHMGVKLAKAMGAHVTVLSTSPKKRDDARGLGADAFVATGEPGAFAKHGKSLDFILDTVSAPHDYGDYLKLLRRDGTMVLVGLPDKDMPLSAGLLVTGRRRLTGSPIGGIRETQEMLDFCARHGALADIEVISIQEINQAYKRLLASDVRYRFVIDLASLR
jgi:uncharacterized zinc-type alcohol dehydrogenase-like protein